MKNTLLVLIRIASFGKTVWPKNFEDSLALALFINCISMTIIVELLNSLLSY